MRFDPVYLVAPESAKEPMRGFSRRALCASAFAAIGFGFALGRSLRSRTLVSAPEEDATVRWALDIQDGHIAALLEKHEAFLLTFVVHEDLRLLTGIRRIANAVIEDEASIRAVRRLVAERVLGVIRDGAGTESLRSLVGPLEACR